MALAKRSYLINNVLDNEKGKYMKTMPKTVYDVFKEAIEQEAKKIIDPEQDAAIKAGARTAMSRGGISGPAKFAKENKLIPNGRMLDFGCGRGVDAAAFNMEHYEPFLSKVQKKDGSGPEVPKEWGQMPSGEFDVVMCTYVLNVVPTEQVEGVIAQIKGKLKPNGVAIVSIRRDLPPGGCTGKGGCVQIPMICLNMGRA